MPANATYSYRARDQRGQMVSGYMVGSSAAEIGERLRAEGHIVLAVEDKPLSSTTELSTAQIRLNEAARRVRREDVIAFCQQLAVMLETGVPLREALESFHAQCRRQEFRTVLESLKNAVYAGENLSTAMARWPKAFPNMMISLCKASEASGTMALMLGRIGNYLAKERRTARQIKGALGYPIFMMSTGLAMTVFLVAFVLPRFAKIYAQRSATLPRPTRILMAISDFCTAQWMYYGPALVVAGIVLFIWLGRPSGRRALDWVRMHAPLLGRMYGQLYLTRAARTMSTLLAAGVNVLDIIDICRGVTSNVYYDELWSRMEQGVREGKQVSDAVMGSDLIPANVASMIASGERSGRLAQVMEKIAEFSEEELDATVKQVTSYIEPIMIIVMGAVIGGIAMALLLPVFSMGKIMSGG
jgi:type II secretory pathway component PulF